VTWVVVGASAGLGRALAERLARERRSLVLVARDERDLAPLAADLAATHGARVRTLAQDAAEPEVLARRLYELLAEEEVEGLLFPVGVTDAGDDGVLDARAAERLVQVNFLSVAAVAGRFLPKLIAQRHGVLVGFGSIAAVRGRSRNVVYAAAKRARESYFESLRHLGEGHGLTVAFYSLGYLDTSQAFGQRLLLPKADPAAVADEVCRALLHRRGKRYFPWFWAPAAAALSFLPWAFFKRMRF
jgi:short-subunit dehydrogenase